MKILNLFAMHLFAVSVCWSQSPEFSGPFVQGIIQNNLINEASGIAASQRNPGILWVHNDSGDSARIFAIDLHGRHRGTVFLQNAENRDWEDIAVGRGPLAGVPYVYVADIGDNNARNVTKFIYRFPEPKFASDFDVLDTTISEYARISFQLQDGARDAETLLSDPLTGDLYIVSKREENVRVYQLEFPHDTTHLNVAHQVAQLPISYIVGGDISHDGREILLKNYTHVFYWQRKAEDSLWQSFVDLPDTLTYDPEPQGEAICWAANDSGYFTVSEEAAGLPAYLFFYRRVTKTGVQYFEGMSRDIFLGQNYPNPFNLQTQIPFSLRQAAYVKLQVMNSRGQIVANLADKFFEQGDYLRIWYGKNSLNQSVSSGFYLYRISVNQEYSEVKKLLLLK